MKQETRSREVKTPSLVEHKSSSSRASKPHSWYQRRRLHCRVTSSSATTRAATTKNVLAMRPMWLGLAGFCWALRARPHAAHEPETWRAGFHTRKHCPATTTGSRRLCGLWYHSIRDVKIDATIAELGHCDEGSCGWQHFSRSTTTRSQGTFHGVEQQVADHRKLHSQLRQATLWITAQLLTARCETL